MAMVQGREQAGGSECRRLAQCQEEGGKKVRPPLKAIASQLHLTSEEKLLHPSVHTVELLFSVASWVNWLGHLSWLTLRIMHGGDWELPGRSATDCCTHMLAARGTLSHVLGSLEGFQGGHVLSSHPF